MFKQGTENTKILIEYDESAFFLLVFPISDGITSTYHPLIQITGYVWKLFYFQNFFKHCFNADNAIVTRAILLKKLLWGRDSIQFD